jgi:hypothetical protein
LDLQAGEWRAHAGACLTFSREGYKFWDFNLRDVADSVFNLGLIKFALSNPSLSVGELYKDLNKKAFLREAQKLMPSLTLDMVEVRVGRVHSESVRRRPAIRMRHHNARAAVVARRDWCGRRVRDILASSSCTAQQLRCA